MNPQLLEPAIAPYISGTRRWCASRFVRLGIGLFAVRPFATSVFALDPEKAINQIVHAAWTAKKEHPVGKHPWARPLLGFAYRTT
jgi:hypothetical protein